MHTSKPSVNVNVTYDIHQQPASELHTNQRLAFVAAGIPHYSHNTQGGITPCTLFGASALQTISRTLGGTGVGDDNMLSDDALQLAENYYRGRDGFECEAALVHRARGATTARPVHSPSSPPASLHSSHGAQRRSPIYEGPPPSPCALPQLPAQTALHVCTAAKTCSVHAAMTPCHAAHPCRPGTMWVLAQPRSRPGA